MGGDIVPDSVNMIEFNPRQRWRRIQELIRRVWQRWLREYLSYIGSPHKWFSKEKNLKGDDVVIVIDPDARRRDWKVLRVVRQGGRGGIAGARLRVAWLVVGVCAVDSFPA